MVCIYCDGKTEVINSRLQKKPNQTWRRRKCQVCQGLFTTIEGADWTGSLLYKGKNGNVEPFIRDVLFLSVYSSLKHRKDALEAATALTNTVMAKLMPVRTNATVEHSQLTEVAIQTLKRFDSVAAIHYKAYHPLQP